MYGADNITVTIAPGVLITSIDDSGISSEQSGGELINNGNILSGTMVAVVFQGNDNTITNNSGHNIAGEGVGILVFGNSVTVTNHGFVAGYDLYGIIFLSDVVVTNDGEIYGRNAGLFATSAGVGGTINNSGLIRSDHVGVLVTNTTGQTTTIDNAAGGTIAGVDAAIATVTLGSISLNNRGTLNGGIDCTATNGNINDVVVNKGRIIGDVHLGAGADFFKGKGGTSGKLFGEDGNDILKGGSHKDVLIGGLDKDILTGRQAADRFVFTNVLDSVVGANRDVITDFHHSQHDKINLSAIGDFHFIGARSFHQVAGELRYDHHLLQGDVDGNGVADFEVRVNAAQLVKGDFIL